MKNKILFTSLLFSSFIGFTQEKQIDSTKVNQLSEVVVTGQFEPQSIKKSVFNVRLITAKDIQNLAANNLSDVLNQYLNITVRPSGTTGRSTVSLFGLDSQYFKIFVDNVPLVNEGGVGNNTDLSQINLNDIEQIEIVEGSMGVTHGANAVSGVLNIVTKKSSVYKWSISATAQEETVKDEYSLFDRGRHIQSLKLSHTFNDAWFVSIGGNRNDFQGFLSDRNGKYYKKNDDTRGYKELPKELTNATALIAYHKNNLRVFYKFEYLDEDADYYGKTVQSLYNPVLGPYLAAKDKRYMVNRYFHNLNATGKIFSRLNYNVSLSHQKQERNVENFDYNLTKREELRNTNEKDQSMEVLYSTGTLSNFFFDKKVDLQLGYEVTNTNGFSRVEEENHVPDPVRKTVENYDFFASSEIRATSRFSIRPGLRFSFQSKFQNQYASSLGLRYLFDKGIELRASYGDSFRTPSFEDLYYNFVNSSHFFIGNENLVPETSTSYEMSFKKTSLFFSGVQVSNTFSGSFLDVSDKIYMAYIGDNSAGIAQNQSLNINKYRVWNFSTTNQFRKDNWSFSFGGALIGVSQRIDNQLLVSDEKYLYSLNLNCSASYGIPKWKTTFSAYYKYNGRTQEFFGDKSGYYIRTTGESNWLEASARKIFFKNKLETTIGARNIFDVTDINIAGRSNAAGHAAPSQAMLGYGRSYFLKLTYNLNF